jgi:hypothetical protein
MVCGQDPRVLMTNDSAITANCIIGELEKLMMENPKNCAKQLKSYEITNIQEIKDALGYFREKYAKILATY